VIVCSCKEFRELDYLIPNAFWNIDDFDAKFERCRMINTITSKDGNLKNGHNLFLLSGKFCEFHVNRNYFIYYHMFTESILR
jgi:hypothetical protein